LFYAFAQDIPINEAEKLLPSVAHSSIVSFYNKIRAKLYAIIEQTSLEGNVNGDSQIVELDESLFEKKQKYHKGKPTKKQWVFGLVERNTRKTYFVTVKDRTRSTLLPIIKKKVKSGTAIYHDDFSVYRNLEEFGYTHEVVVHKENFVSPSGVCTNNIEGKMHSLEET
jgi:transposase-like protein